jgi:hypothetical protein
MEFATFYQTVAQLCFTLLGLWWLVLQTKYADWSHQPARRRMATNISLYFLLPGAMSLLALLAAQAAPLWRGAFIVAGIFGIIETGSLVFGARPPTPKTTQARRHAVFGQSLRIAGLVLYVLVVLVALLADVIRGTGLAPLTFGGVLVTLLVVLGLSLAWTYFVEPPLETA